MDTYSQCFACGNEVPDGGSLCKKHREEETAMPDETMAQLANAGIMTGNATAVKELFDMTDTSGAAAYAAEIGDTHPPTYTVFVTIGESPDENEFCRHSVIANAPYEAALAAVEECRLTNYRSTMVAEVFPPVGIERRFSYQLVAHNS